MIYFDNEKQAYGFEIHEPLATVDETIWIAHSGFEAGTTWDIVEGKFKELTDPIEKEKREKRITEVKAELESLDLKSIRALRAGDDSDLLKLADIEAVVIELRDELAALEAQ